MSQIHFIKQGQSDVVSIKSIQFGVLSPDAILQQSVAHIYKHMTKGGDLAGTLSDPRLGATQNTRNAITYLSAKTDHGNFGHCHLAMPVYHPLFYKVVFDIMRLICPGCSSLRESKEFRAHEIKAMVSNVAPHERLHLIGKKLKVETGKVETGHCPKCSSPYPWIQNDNDGQILGMTMLYNKKHSADKRQKDLPTPINAKQVHEILKRITDEDAEILGLNPEHARPEWMIITILPICPPTIRPSVVTEDGKTSDDDITQSLHNIIKFNNKLKETLDMRDRATATGGSQSDQLDQMIASDHRTLQLHIASLIDNETNTYPTICNRANRKLRTIKARLGGKQGRLRGNLMGKRVDFSARTVITADPNLSITEVGIPYHIAMTLTYPEHLNEYNRDYLTELVRRGPEKYPGANEYKLPNSSYPTNLSCISDEERIAITLPLGTIVYRHMLDGDLVILNRQPSLHKMNMMCHRVRILTGNTFRLSVNITSPYGADFDGDEMNIHLLQSEMARREWQSLALSSTQMVSPQANKPVVGCVQDTVLAMYRLSSEHYRGYAPEERYYLNIRDFMHLMAWANQNTGHYPEKSALGWTTVDMFNMIMPPITINKKNTMDDPLDIINGVMQGPRAGNRMGNMDTATGLLKTSYGSLFHVTWNDIGHTAASDLIDNMSRLSSQWLMMDGFSVGLRDLQIPEIYMKEIDNFKVEYMARIQTLLKGLHEGRYTEEFRASLDLGPPGLVENIHEQFELDIMHLMAKCREQGQGVAYRHVTEYEPGQPYDNRFMSMVNSGSKGNKSNVVQIIALLGNQDMMGQRVGNYYNRRPLAFVTKDDLGAESRGFIANSYTKGLSFMEYIYHAMAGRNGVISTSIKTAETGYLQRKLMKRLEDIVANYDGTVRGGGGSIIQYIYGGDGYDGSKIERESLKHIGWNMEEMLLRFKFSQADWDNFQELTEQSGSTFNMAKEQEAIEKEFAKLVEDWTYLRRRYRFNLPEGIPSVVNFDRLIKSVMHRMGLRGKAPYFKSEDVLLPSYIVEQVTYMERTLRLPTTESINKYSMQQFFALLRAKLSSRYLIMVHTFNKTGFDALLSEIKQKFYQGIVAPGEAVGALAAQSIGEPGTQMTLDSFHSTGSKATVAAGVPRFKEILSVTSVKMPSIAIYLTGIDIPDKIMEVVRRELGQPDLPATIRSVDLYLAHVATTTDLKTAQELKKTYVNQYLLSNEHNSIFKVRDSFEYLTYGDIIDRSDVIYVAGPDDDPDRIALNYLIPFELDSKEYEYPMWLIKCEVNRKHSVDILNINFNIEDMQFSYLPGVNHSFIRGCIHVGKASMDKIAEIEEALRGRAIKGIPGIRKTTIRTEKKDIKLDDGTIVPRDDSHRYPQLSSISMDADMYIIDTIGSNLMEIISMNNVDPYRTFTNDITEMMEIFGVEVARKSIIRELNAVLAGSGIQVDIRHITLLADAMTCRGFIQKIDRFGAKKGESGPLALASFEETMAMLGKAAAFAQVDTLGVSANIMLGQYAKLGTNSFETYLDEAMILQHAEKRAAAPRMTLEIKEEDACDGLDELNQFEFVL